ncbi:MAG TPA: ATPase, T2SS/T4P/T4SS family [Thermoleophilia bacterium]|nr:ATPase, T2SS/T4P/T4SS family [Thermoleophilia bacterium]HQF52742.1 ATPase, T2SS/T4P/T4SS family [Thermoleophilia bacterium]
MDRTDTDTSTAAPREESRPAPEATTPADVADDPGGRDVGLRAVQTALLQEIDASIAGLERTRLGEGTLEHLEILRSLLTAQVTAYFEHFLARRARLVSHTSIMYAGEVGAPGVISTTFRGLLDGGTLNGGQAAKLAQLLADRRTLIVFGDRATGKSTLLNSLFDLIPVDERLIALQRGPGLPALKERAFCLRLNVDDETDVPALFAKARRMAPGRVVVSEMHPPEVREFFAMLAEDPAVGGLATLQAESVRGAVDTIAAAMDGDAAKTRSAVAAVRPVFVHMRSDEGGSPRLAALWGVKGIEDGELVLGEVQTGAPAASRLVAEA